tara:strand:- start:9894 stop:13568 length:3675 start_codon:yes stop_codon:yes gene_type:complete
MSKYTTQALPQTFKNSPKASHFTPDYIIVCENNLIVSSLGLDYTIWGTPGGDGFSNTDSPWWIQAFDTHGGIPTLDPFRAKTFRFWIATRTDSPESDTIIKPSKINSSKPYIMTSNTSGDFMKGGLPVQMRVAATGNPAAKLDYSINHGSPYGSLGSFTKKPLEKTNNPYGVGVVENIDFVVKKNDPKVSSIYSVQQNNGIICAVAGSFLDPAVSIENYDPETGENILQLPSIAINLSPSGMPTWNQEEVVLSLFSDAILGRMFSPIALTAENQSSTFFLGGKSFKTTDSQGGSVYDTRGAYYDAVFAVPAFVSSQAIEDVDGLSDDFNISAEGAYYADIDPVYNYLSDKYEKDIAPVHHTKLPNIYDYMKKLESVEAFGDDTGATITSDLKSLYLFQTNNENKYWANYVGGLDSPELASHKHKHIFVSNQGNYAPSVVDDYKDNFPMYNEISFRSHSGDQAIMGALKTSETSENLYKSILKHLFAFHPMSNLEELLGDHEIKDFIGSKFIYSPYSADGDGGVTGFKFKAGVEENVIISQTKQNNQPGVRYNYESGGKFGVYNFDKWIDTFLEGDTEEFVDGALGSQAVALEKKEEAFNKTVSMFVPEKKQYKNPLLIIFQSLFGAAELKTKMSEIVQQKMRSHTELFDGQKAYSEVLYYRIEKRHNGQAIQSFWIENTPGNDVMKYYDTQVKYGEDYEYRIHAYTAVIGTKYRYSASAFLPRVIDYFTPSATDNPLDYTFDSNTFNLNMINHVLSSVPTGFQTAERGRLYPYDLNYHKSQRWKQYVDQHPAFYALNALYETKQPIAKIKELQKKKEDAENSYASLVAAVAPGVALNKAQDKIDEYQSGIDEQIQILADSGVDQGSIFGALLSDTDSEEIVEKIDILKSAVDAEAENDTLQVYESSTKVSLFPGIPVESAGDAVAPAEVATRIQAVAEPYVKIMEVPMFSETVSVVDNPPLAPHVTFNGFVGVNNKVLFSFDNAVGEELAVPIILNGDDPSAFDKIRRKQDRDYTHNDTEYNPENKSNAYVKQKITYKADDFASEYQVFRRFNKPSSPNDFTLEDRIVSLDTAEAASFVDNISPNTKVYYMFRSVDRHGHVSNPSETYQVEIVDDDGAVYILVDVIDYQKKGEPGTRTRSFKRYLQLDPAFLQTLINESKTNFGNSNTALGTNPVLGVLSDSIYDNKKFKVRVTSRATGKKIDINLEFKKELDELAPLGQPDIY